MRYSNIGEEDEEGLDEEEEETYADKSATSDKYKFFSIQINSPIEENMAQIVEHLYIPTVLNQVIDEIQVDQK